MSVRITTTTIKNAAWPIGVATLRKGNVEFNVQFMELLVPRRRKAMVGLIGFYIKMGWRNA